jgi:outer membrane biosynthesis protein TonB
VRLPFDVIDRLERETVENFRSIDALGSEIGGLLFGGPDPNTPTKVRIEDFELVQCDYSRGPFYRLSDADLARFDAAIERHGGAGVAGFFRSHSRKGLTLDAEDMKVLEARFREPWQIAVLVRPFATKVSAGGIFIWEDGRMRGEASYLEFPFRSSELTPAESEPDPPVADSAAPALKPPTRGVVTPMPSRLKIARSSSTSTVSGWVEPAVAAMAQAPPPPEAEPAVTRPAATVKTEEPIPVAAAAPAKPMEPPKLATLEPEPKAQEPIPEPKAVETEAAEGSILRSARGKLLWLAVAAALAACSATLFLYPGLFRHAARPGAALTLRIERTATDLLLTWNRDSDAIHNAKKAILSISDGDRQENLDLNLSDLRNGSIVYSPLSSDVSFRMEVMAADQSKTVSESVRVLRTKPSPMGTDAAVPNGKTKQDGAPRPDGGVTPADQTATAAAEEAPAPKRTPTGTFNVASLAQRLRPALPSDMPDAPALTETAGSSGSVNLGAFTPAASLTAPRPSAPADAKSQAEPARDVRQPQLITRVNPVYPTIARQRRIFGTVSVSVLIGADGKVGKVTPLSGPEILWRPATEAIKQWVYTPMTLNGHAVETEKQIDLNFTLNK